MKTDKSGCSTCPIGQEQYEKFFLYSRRKKVYYFQYEYRHTDGNLFVVTRPTLKECREVKEKWLHRLAPIDKQDTLVNKDQKMDEYGIIDTDLDENIKYERNPIINSDLLI
jgi:hypothetical protein